MTSPGDASRVGFPRALRAWIVAWISIAILAVIWGIPNEQNDLTDRSSALLADSDLDIKFHGRDATILGSADQPTLDAAENAILNLRGVRRVNTSAAVVVQDSQPPTTDSPVPLTTAAPETIAPVPNSDPSFSASFADGTVELAGVLPTAALVTDIEMLAQEQLGASVVSSLEVGNVSSPEYLAHLGEVFAVAAGLDPWSFSLDTEGTMFTGMAPNAATVDDRAAAIDSFATERNLGEVGVALQINPEAVAASLTELLAEGTNFETGSAQLSEEAAGRLSTVTAIMLANPATNVTVEGHTDDQGDAEANQLLSEERAQAVVDYLMAGGVDADRLLAVGYGEQRPIADNDTEEGRAINRRIEFVVSGGEQP